MLITGAAGFIGSTLVDRLLSSENQVYGVDNFDPFYGEEIKRRNIKDALANDKFVLYEGDFGDAALLDKIFSAGEFDCVIHLAAKAGVRPSILDPKGYYQVNVMSTLSLLEAMKRNNLTKLVFASSSSVYGNNDSVPFQETDSVDEPISPYASTKKAGELLCHTYHHLHGFDIFCLRFFTVYGPRQRPDLAIHKFTERILKNDQIELYGDGSSARDYTYVDDIVEGVCAAMEKVKGFEVINLGESNTIQLKDLVSKLENVIGKKAMIKRMPEQPGDVKRTYANISKAKQLLGYSPRVSKEQGLEEFVKWKISISKS